MRKTLIPLAALVALAGCTGQQVKEASGAVAGGLAKSALYVSSGQAQIDQENCRQNNAGARNEACERRKQQSFLNETAENAVAGAESRDQARRFEEGMNTVRGTPDCISDGVNCSDPLKELEPIVKKQKSPKRVVSRDNRDFTQELKSLLAQ